MKSIVPEMINSKNMKFNDERDVEIKITPESNSKYSSPFSHPYLIIDTFAKKTKRTEQIVPVNDEELKQLKFNILVIKATKSTRWKPKQQVIYRLEKKSNPVPNARKINYIPTNHKTEKDVSNNRIRIVGPNAGYPHYLGDNGGHGPWNEI